MLSSSEGLLRVAYREVAATLSAPAVPSDFFPTNVFDDLAVQRGFLDLRGLALRAYDGKSLAKMAPEWSDDKTAWLSALDAFATVFSDIPDNMPGALNNIGAFHAYVSSGDYRHEPGFDKAAYIVTHDFLKKIFPERHDFKTQIVYSAEELERAQATRGLYAERLERNASLIKAVIEEVPDPQALAHILAGSVGNVRRMDESKDIFEKMLADITSAGLVVPKELLLLLAADDFKDENLKALRRLFSLDHSNDEVVSAERRLKTEEFHLKKQEKKISLYQRSLRRATNTRKKKKIHQRLDGLQHDFAIRESKVAALRTLAQSEEKDRQALGDILKGYKHFFMTHIEPQRQVRQLQDETLDDLYVKYAQDLKMANRIGRQMAQYILSPVSTRLERFQSEGILDSGLLPGIVIDPFSAAAANPYYQRQESFGQKLDTCITLLADKSGSMRGEKIAMAYIAAERLAYWLSTAGVQMEVLSYTDTDYRIYKEFSAPFKPNETKKIMGGLLTGRMSSTPTKEATVWAHDRLLRGPAKRKIMMVLTDGEPDNKGSLLRVHRWIEGSSPIELVGVGIMHDVSDSYERHIYVEKPSDLIESMAAQVRAMMDRPQESYQRLKRTPQSAADFFGVHVDEKKLRSRKVLMEPKI